MYYQIYKSLQMNNMLPYKIQVMLEFFKTPSYYLYLIQYNTLKLICFISFRMKSVFKFFNVSRLDLKGILFKNLLFGYMKY